MNYFVVRCGEDSERVAVGNRLLNEFIVAMKDEGIKINETSCIGCDNSPCTCTEDDLDEATDHFFGSNMEIENYVRDIKGTL